MPSSLGPIQVQGGERGAAKRPLLCRCARRRCVSTGPLTRNKRAVAVGGKGERGGRVGAQTVGRAWTRGQATQHVGARPHTEEARPRLPPGATCRPTAHLCAAFCLSLLTAALNQDKWSPTGSTSAQAGGRPTCRSSIARHCPRDAVRDNVGGQRGREAALDESRRRNASHLQSQRWPRRGGGFKHIQLMGVVVSAWPSVRSRRRVHELRLVLCTSLLDRLGKIWRVDQGGFSPKTSSPNDSSRRCRELFFASMYIDERNAIQDGGSVFLNSTVNHGSSLENDLLQNDYQLCRRRPSLTSSYLATSLPQDVGRGTDATRWPGGAPSCPPHHECPNPYRWRATRLSSGRLDAGRRR